MSKTMAKKGARRQQRPKSGKQPRGRARIPRTGGPMHGKRHDGSDDDWLAEYEQWDALQEMQAYNEALEATE